MNSALKPVLSQSGVSQPSSQSSPAKATVATANLAVGLPQGAISSLHTTTNSLVGQNLSHQLVNNPQVPPYAAPSMAPISANMAQMAANMSHHGNLSHVTQSTAPVTNVASTPTKSTTSTSPLSLVQEKPTPAQPLALTRSLEKNEPDSTGQANGTIELPVDPNPQSSSLLKQETLDNLLDKQDITTTSPGTLKPLEILAASEISSSMDDLQNPFDPKVVGGSELIKLPAKPSEVTAVALDIATIENDISLVELASATQSCYKQVQHDNVPTQSENEPSQSNVEATKLDIEQTQLDKDLTQPDKDQTEPDKEQTEPDKDHALPDKDQTQPDKDQTQSDKNIMQPADIADDFKPQVVNDPLQLDNFTTQQDISSTQLDNEPSQSDHASAQPKSDPLQPNNDSSIFKNDPSQPNSDPTKLNIDPTHLINDSTSIITSTNKIEGEEFDPTEEKKVQDAKEEPKIEKPTGEENRKKVNEENNDKQDSDTNIITKTEAKAPVKSTLKLATVTPLRKRRHLSDPDEKAEPSDETPNSRTKRNRTQVQLYQASGSEISNSSPGALLASKSKDQSIKKDKLRLFVSGEYVAVRNADNGYYVCQLLQNVYRTTGRIRIRWLSRMSSSSTGDVYKHDYCEHIDMGCLMTTLDMKRVTGGYLMKPEDRARVLSILERALRAAEQGATSVDLPKEHPDGVDVTLVTDESELDIKTRKRPSSKSSPRSVSKPRTKSDVNTKDSEGEATPSKKASRSKTPKKSRKSEGSTPSEASTSKTATTVTETPKNKNTKSNKKTTKKESPKPTPVKGRRSTRESKSVLGSPGPSSSGKSTRAKRQSK